MSTGADGLPARTPKKSVSQRIRHELQAFAGAALYFGVWIGALLILKSLLLAEHDIKFYGFSAAIVGALVLAKVVLTLQYVPLGGWVRSRPAWVDVLLRTVLYSLGVVVALAVEHGVRERHEYGGFIPALTTAFDNRDPARVWVNTFCISGGLLGYNVLTVIRRHLGQGAILRMMLMPMPEKPKAWTCGGPDHPTSSPAT